MKTFNFNFDFRSELVAEKLELFFSYLIPILNDSAIEKFKNILYTIQDLLYEDFNFWFVFMNKELVAASSNFIFK